VDGESLAQHALVERIDRTWRFLVDGGGGPPEQSAVGSAMIVLVDEGPEADVELVQGAEGADEIEASFA
jgi:hypothetical protein